MSWCCALRRINGHHAITDLIAQRIPLEDVQKLVGHKDARTTKLYDRSERKVTRNIVERIST